MKCFVKILFFPIIFLLSILTAFLRFVLGIGTMVLSLFEIIILLGAIEAFLPCQSCYLSLRLAKILQYPIL